MLPATPSPAIDVAPGRVLLLWPGGRVPATLLALLDDAGAVVDPASGPDAAAQLFALHRHGVILAPPPAPGDSLWLGPLLQHGGLPVETVALVNPDSPLAEAAWAAGADALADPYSLTPRAFGWVLERAQQRAKLKRESLALAAAGREANRQQRLFRRCLELLATVEGEPLQELILKTFAEIGSPQSVALWLRTGRDQLALRAHRGDAALAALPPQIDPREGPLSTKLARGQPFLTADLASPESVPLGSGTEMGPGMVGLPSGLCVPLLAEAQLLGLLWLSDKAGVEFSRTSGEASGEAAGAAEALADCRAMAEVAGLALRNGRRFRELERAGLRDRDSPTYTLSYFVDYAGKELYKASRYGRQFSVSALKLDNLEQLRVRLAPAAFAEALRDVFRALAGLARDSDVLARGPTPSSTSSCRRPTASG